MGGVVLFFDHMLICKRLSILSDYSASEIYKIIFTEGLEKRYDEGRISSNEFYEKIIELLKIDILFDEFCEIWSDIFWENTKMWQFIRDLKRIKYKVYLLSNTNELHFQFVKNKFFIINEFDEYILSYIIGYRKPHPKMFQVALEKSGLNVSNHIYIDDKEEFAKAAQSIGMIGINFISINQLKNEFQQNGISFKL